MIERGTPMTFVEGSTLLQHGEATRHCYAIRDGEVLVSAPSGTGATVILARRGAGSVVGELAALDGLPRSATVRAVTEVSAVMLGATQVERLLRDRPDLAIAELRRMSGELRELTERFALRDDEIRRRIVGLVETNARESGEVLLEATPAEIAGWVRSPLEATTRALRDLEVEGVLVLRPDSVELTEAPRHLGVV